jgi:uncharacterized protein YqhQ
MKMLKIANTVVLTLSNLLALGAERIPVGGQAVIEGVLMRGPHKWGLSVRRPEGELWSTSWRNLPWTATGIWKYPVFRGMATMAEMLTVGMRALSQSAQVALGEEEKITPREMILSVSWRFSRGGPVRGVSCMACGPVAPLLGASGLLKHLVEGLVRALVFIAYVGVVGLWKDMARIFAYHGAEHKTINAYEHDASLVPEVVARYSRIHQRCGTSFLLIVVAVSVVVFSLAGGGPLWWRALSRVFLLPPVIGISYELIKWSCRSGRTGELLMKPALLLQYFTTREPDLEQIAVGVASLQRLSKKGKFSVAAPERPEE